MSADRGALGGDRDGADPARRRQVRGDDRGARDLRRPRRAARGIAPARFPCELHLRAGDQGLHRRSRADDHRRPAPEAVRDRQGQRRLLRAGLGLPDESGRDAGADAARRRAVARGRARAAKGRAGRPGLARRRAARHPRGRRLQPRQARRRDRRPHRRRPAALRPPRHQAARLRPARLRRRRRDAGRLRGGSGRGQDLRGARALRDRPQPRADRSRHREPRQRPLVGHGGQRQPLQDRRQRWRRCSHAALGADRRGAHGRHAADPHRPLRAAARGDAGRRRHRGRDRARRLPRADLALPRHDARAEPDRRPPGFHRRRSPRCSAY